MFFTKQDIMKLRETYCETIIQRSVLTRDKDF